MNFQEVQKLDGAGDGTQIPPPTITYSVRYHLLYRWRCVNCGATFTHLPSLCVPFMQVYNSELGGIMFSRGNSAVYESNGRRGQNVVHVRDQGGREGMAFVNQP